MNLSDAGAIAMHLCVLMGFPLLRLYSIPLIIHNSLCIDIYIDRCHSSYDELNDDEHDASK